MRKLLHTGHPGIVNMKMKARNVLFWPGMNKELEDFIDSCSACQESRNQQQKEPLISHDIPSTVWTKVGTDLFTLYNKDYLIIADYTSKLFIYICYPTKHHLQSSVTQRVHLQSLEFQRRSCLTMAQSLLHPNTNNLPKIGTLTLTRVVQSIPKATGSLNEQFKW